MDFAFSPPCVRDINIKRFATFLFYSIRKSIVLSISIICHYLTISCAINVIGILYVDINDKTYDL